MEIRLRFRTEHFERAIRELGDRAISAQVRALNRSALSVRTFMQRAIAKDTGLKVGVVRDAMRISKASRDRLTAFVVSQGFQIPLIDFRAKGPYPSRGRGRGVTARLPQTRRYAHAFIGVMKSGHRGVFQRRGRARLPIYELHGPSIAHVFGNLAEEGLAVAEESLVKNLEHELIFALDQLSR